MSLCIQSSTVAEQPVDKVASIVVPLQDSPDRAYYGLLFKLCGKEMKGLRGLEDGKGRSQDSTAVKNEDPFQTEVQDCTVQH